MIFVHVTPELPFASTKTTTICARNARFRLYEHKIGLFCARNKSTNKIIYFTMDFRSSLLEDFHHIFLFATVPFAPEFYLCCKKIL